jgi:hypothetical protein
MSVQETASRDGIYCDYIKHAVANSGKGVDPNLEIK